MRLEEAGGVVVQLRCIRVGSQYVDVMSKKSALLLGYLPGKNGVHVRS